MIDLPTSRPDKAEVRRAGKALKKSDIIYSPEAAPEIHRIFRVANAWRDLHAYPMERVRAQVIGQLNRLRLRGKLTAARLKRMPSIRKKLRTRHLDVIQDLAGIRVILPAMEQVEAVADACRSGLAHRIYEEDDYIAAPRKSGYRSLHLKLEYVPSNELEIVCEGCRVELQIRTRFQHSWATAVEAVGLFRGENLKGGEGSPDWLRLFVLMASEMARIEERPELEGTPSHAERVRELRDLNKRLKAAAFLDSISHAVDYTDRYYQPQPSEFYLIRFDLETRTVKVDGYNASSGTQIYHATEQGSDRYDTVLVATDKVGSLKRAFPNYFGDTRRFATSLRKIIRGEDVPEFVLPLQAPATPRSRELIDPSWLRRVARPRTRSRS